MTGASISFCRYTDIHSFTTTLNIVIAQLDVHCDGGACVKLTTDGLCGHTARSGESGQHCGVGTTDLMRGARERYMRGEERIECLEKV